MPTFGDITQFLSGQYFGRPSFPSADLSGKTMIITGGNVGLGFEAAKHLIALDLSTLVLACRDTKKGEAAKALILSSTSKKPDVQVWAVDVDSYASVLAFCERASTTLSRLDALIANAGAEFANFATSEGLEQSLTINVLSTYLMAFALLPKLKSTSSTHDVDTTLSIIGSMIHVFGPDKQVSSVSANASVFDALSNEKTADMPSRYPLSKLIAHLVFLQFAAHVDNNINTSSTSDKTSQQGRVIVNLVNPGWCLTSLGRHKPEPFVQRVMANIFRRTGEMGSRTLVHGASAGRDSDGKYLSECQVKEQSTYVRSEEGKEMSRRLWMEVVERLEGVERGITGVAA